MTGKAFAYFHRPAYYLFCRRSSPVRTSKHVAFRATPLIASWAYDKGSSRMYAGTDARRSPMKTIAICGAFLLAAIPIALALAGNPWQTRTESKKAPTRSRPPCNTAVAVNKKEQEKTYA